MTSQKVQGYAAALVAAATYGMNPLFALPLYAEGMGTISVLFWRYVLAVPIIALMAAARGQSFRLDRKQFAVITILGLLMGYSSLALFESYNLMAASIASTLLFVYPLMVAVLMAIFFRERLTVKTCTCLALALGGIGLLYKAADGATLSPAGMAWVMSSSLAYAIYIVYINRSGLATVPTLILTFYSLLAGSVIFIGAGIGEGGITVPSTPLMWGCVLCLALLPTALSMACTTVAVNRIGSTPTAILGVFEPVTAIVIGVAVFGEQLTPRDVTGLVLIITAVTIVVAGSSFGRVAQHLVAVRRLFPRRWHLRK